MPLDFVNRNFAYFFVKIAETDFNTQISGKKSLPNKSLVNEKADMSQPRIKSGFLQEVREADGAM